MPRPLPRRALGRTGVELPVLGFGVSGPHATRLVHKMDTVALIAQALNAGVELVDTAPFYGNGEAERRLGFTLSASDLPVFVCTKAGTSKDGRRWSKDFSVGGVEASLESSLERLGRVDALFLHGPAASDLTDALLARLQALKAAGTIGFIGVAGRGEELDAAISCGAFDLLMAPATEGIAPTLAATLAQAKANGLGVIGIEAMGASVRGPRFPRRFSDLWRLARERTHDHRVKKDAAPQDQFAKAFAAGHADVLLTTTTRTEHLAQNLETARAAA